MLAKKKQLEICWSLKMP